MPMRFYFERAGNGGSSDEAVAGAPVSASHPSRQAASFFADWLEEV